MKFNDLKVLEKLSIFGVAHRNELKNYSNEIKRLMKLGFVAMIWKKGFVYYELTEKAVPVLEERRQQLLHLAKMKLLLSPGSQVHKALVEDLRFLDLKHPEAKRFRFLGDWQLKRPCVYGQLALAQHRYYKAEGLA